MRINPKNFFKRELDILPPHFVNTVVKANEYEMVKIEEWIYNYCTGRYCIVDDIYFTKDRTSQVKVIGFENAGDLTLFGLSGLAQSR